MQPMSYFTNPPDLGDIDALYRRVSIIHTIFIVNVLAFGFIGVGIKLFIFGDQPGFIGFDAEVLIYITIALAVISVILGFIILVIHPRQNSPQNIAKKTTVTSLPELGQTLFQSHMMRISMAQAIMVFAIVLFFLNGNLIHLFSFGVASLILQLLIRPHESDWHGAKAIFDQKIL